jgi:hypothetical protein
MGSGISSSMTFILIALPVFILSAATLLGFSCPIVGYLHKLERQSRKEDSTALTESVLTGWRSGSVPGDAVSDSRS